MKLAIIGNGIIGLSCAYEVLRADKDIEVIIIGKKSRIGAGSLAAGAMLNSYAELDEDSLKNEIDLFRFELSRNASEKWPIFFERVLNDLNEKQQKLFRNNESAFFGKDKVNGTYIVNNTSADALDDENFNAIENGLKKYNQNYKKISGGEIPNYKPCKRNRATRALMLEDEGWVSPNNFLEMLSLSLNKNSRATFVDFNADVIKSKSNLIKSVILENKIEIMADSFLIANGASFSDLIKKSKLQINTPRIFYGIGTSILVSLKNGHEQESCIRTPNRGLACGIYSIPQPIKEEDNIRRVLIGATNYISHQPAFNPRLSNVKTILGAVSKEINTDYDMAEVIKTNIGWRPTSSDTYPIIGKTKSILNCYIATGTKRDGFHLAPEISEIISNLILNKKVDKRIDFFQPERELIRNISREKAIDNCIKHLMSAAYQHDYVPSNEKQEDLLIKAYKDDLNKLHDNVKAIDWGIPPELISMYRYGYI